MNLGKLEPSRMKLGTLEPSRMKFRELEPSRMNCYKLERSRMKLGMLEPSRMNLIVPFFGSGVAWSLCFIKIGAHATQRETQFVILRKVV